MAVHEQFWRIARPRSHFLGAVQVLGRPSASQRKKMDAVPFFLVLCRQSLAGALSSSSSSLIRQCLADLITIRDGSAALKTSPSWNSNVISIDLSHVSVDVSKPSKSKPEARGRHYVDQRCLLRWFGWFRYDRDMTLLLQPWSIRPDEQVGKSEMCRCRPV